MGFPGYDPESPPPTPEERALMIVVGVLALIAGGVALFFLLELLP